jgi:hypothetical protein
MTATQVFLRFLKENGYYTKYSLLLRRHYLNVKKIIIGRNGEEYWDKNFYKPLIKAHSRGKQKCKEKNIMLDALLMYTQYRFIDSFYVIGVYEYKKTSELYRFSIKRVKRYQLTRMRTYLSYSGQRKILQFEYK